MYQLSYNIYYFCKNFLTSLLIPVIRNDDWVCLITNQYNYNLTSLKKIINEFLVGLEEVEYLSLILLYILPIICNIT